MTISFAGCGKSEVLSTLSELAELSDSLSSLAEELEEYDFDTTDSDDQYKDPAWGVFDEKTRIYTSGRFYKTQGKQFTFTFKIPEGWDPPKDWAIGELWEIWDGELLHQSIDFGTPADQTDQLGNPTNQVNLTWHSMNDFESWNAYSDTLYPDTITLGNYEYRFEQWIWDDAFEVGGYGTRDFDVCTTVGTQVWAWNMNTQERSEEIRAGIKSIMESLVITEAPLQEYN
jgi:hypothetical protein